MVSDRALWQAINAHDLDAADAALPFSRRLMRETGWTHAFAKRAIREYKAFIYLICTAGTMLSPSDEVDQVWHLHLLYTRDYWDRFCGEVLKRRIHHSPTAGGAAEDTRYTEAYERTRTLYRAEFGAPPPLDLWPDADSRFRPATASFNASDYIHLPKRQVFLCLTGIGLALLTGCTPQSAITLWQTHHVMALCAAAFVWWLMITWTARKDLKRKGFAGYVLGSVIYIPVFTLMTHLLAMALAPSAHGDWGGDLVWLLAAMINVALWPGFYLSPGRKGGDGGSGCGSSGGHGGCGGHGCGSGCGGH